MKDADENITDEGKERIKEEVNILQEHTCLKNYDGCSKEMESDSIVNMVTKAPEEMNAYIRNIIMDGDANRRDIYKKMII